MLRALRLCLLLYLSAFAAADALQHYVASILFGLLLLPLPVSTWLLRCTLRACVVDWCFALQAVRLCRLFVVP